MASKNKPKHEVRLGRIKGTIWENETKTGPRCNVTFTRIYKDGDKWADSASFGRDDLQLLAKVADMAHSWIYENSTPSTNHDEENEPHY